MLPKTQLGEFGLSGEVCERGGGRAGEWANGGGVGRALPLSTLPLSRENLIRPLLARPRAAIEAYCAEHSLPPALRPQQRGHDPLSQPAAPRVAADPGRLQSSDSRGVGAHRRGIGRGSRGAAQGGGRGVGSGENVREGERGSEGMGEWKDGGFPPPPTPPHSHSPALHSLLLDVVHFALPAWRPCLSACSGRRSERRSTGCAPACATSTGSMWTRAGWLAREGTMGQKATLAAGLELEISYGTLRIGPETGEAGERGSEGGGEHGTSPILPLSHSPFLPLPLSLIVGDVSRCTGRHRHRRLADRDFVHSPRREVRPYWHRS